MNIIITNTNAASMSTIMTTSAASMNITTITMRED